MLIDLVKDKNLKPEAIAIGCNNQIINRDDWGKIRLKDHDVIDVVMFMMGG